VIDATGRPASQLQAFLSLALLAVIGVSLLASPGPDGLLGAFLGLLMIAIAVTDNSRYIIPNELTAAAFALALLRASTVGPDADWSGMIWAILRAAAITVPFLALMIAYRRWRGRDGLGLGDVKLAAVAGAWLDWVTIFAVIELAALSALSAYFVNAYVRKRPLKATAFLPFGLFLGPAIWIGWLAEAWLG
jgi:leader peptidase (prepilin peptidase)/N-methyltransferase